jgi:protein-tyrosine phosphatase
MTRPFYPEKLWNEILPGLFQGGTDEHDELGAFLKRAPENMRSWQAQEYIAATQIKAHEFDTVVTAYVHANPCGHNVKELRFTFFDGNMNDFDPEQDLFWLVREAHADWKEGKQVLIRCQAGINRSGLIMALVLIRDGYTPVDAIKLIREKRCEAALSNEKFEAWLLNLADVDYWRSGLLS